MINAVAAVQNVSTNPQQRETNPYIQQLLKVKNLIESSKDKRCYFDASRRRNDKLSDAQRV